MSISPAEIAEAIGLTGYAVNGAGIGGMLKTRVADFRVEEEIKKISMDPKGRFTIAQRTLTNWETNRFINRLAKTLKMSRDRIWFAGTKDKRAITKQLFVIDSKLQKVQNVEIPDAEIEILGRSHQKLNFGSHRGNKFTIVLRGCANEDGTPMSEEDALAEVESIKVRMDELIGKGRFPNWIGPQRFGANRPVTAAVGRCVVEGRWKDAVETYIGMEGLGESEEADRFREFYRKGGSPQDALEICPRHLGYEGSMLKNLINRPDDWVGAFKALPRNLQLMTVHAIQSEAFNRYLYLRFKNNLPLRTPIIGDYVAPLDETNSLEIDRSIVVNELTLPRVSRNCEKGRLAVTGFLPGANTVIADGPSGELEKEILKQMNLHDLDWQVEKIRRLTSKGNRRALLSHYSDFLIETVPKVVDESLSMRWQEGPQEGDRWHPEGACIRFRFLLPPGAYATTFIREFIRGPVHHL